jgi:hypothetical protein
MVFSSYVGDSNVFDLLRMLRSASIAMMLTVL